MTEKDKEMILAAFCAKTVDGPHRVVCDRVPAEWVVEILRVMPRDWSLVAFAEPAEEGEIWAAIEASDIPPEALLPLTTSTATDPSEQAGYVQDFYTEMQVWMLATADGAERGRALVKEFLPMVSYEQAAFMGPAELVTGTGMWFAGDTLAIQVVDR